MLLQWVAVFLVVVLLLLSCISLVWLCATPQTAVPGILQARILEWVAISFSNAWKWKLKLKSLSHVQLLVTPWTAAYQAFPGVGCHCLLPFGGGEGLKYCENYQNVIQVQEVSKCCWTNGIDRLVWCRVSTDLQFVRNAVSANCTKIKYNKMRYAYIK